MLCISHVTVVDLNGAKDEQKHRDIQMIKSFWLREEDETFSIWKVKSNKYVYCSNVKS